MHAPDFGGKTKEGVICQGFPPQPNNQILKWRLKGLAGVSGWNTKSHRGQIELTVSQCSMSGWSTLSIYSGCRLNMDAAICFWDLQYLLRDTFFAQEAQDGKVADVDVSDAMITAQAQ